MLVLTRRRRESLLIGENIEVKVLEIKNKTVVIGINAPKHINIARHELLNRIPVKNKA